MSFKVGDRVRLTDEKQAQPGVMGTYGPGTVTALSEYVDGYLTVEFDSIEGHPLLDVLPDGEKMLGSVRPEEIQLIETDMHDYVAPGTARRRAVGGCTPEPYVRPTVDGGVWVTLPGDNSSHQLGPGEARKLFRELEEVV